MRQLFRIFLTGVVALYITTRVVPGFIIEGSIVDFLVIAILFTVVQRLVKPLIHILLLPFHFVTLGTIAWVVNLLTLYALTFFIAKVKITGFVFTGINTLYFSIPEIQMTAFMTALLTSLCLGVFGAFLHWLME